MEKASRPKELPGMTAKVETGCGNLYVTISVLDGEIFEVFAKLGKAGGCMSANLEALTRSITTGLRCGVPVEYYVDELKDIMCPSMIVAPDDKRVLSCADAIAQVLSGKWWAKQKKESEDE